MPQVRFNTTVGKQDDGPSPSPGPAKLALRVPAVTKKHAGQKLPPMTGRPCIFVGPLHHTSPNSSQAPELPKSNHDRHRNSSPASSRDHRARHGCAPRKAQARRGGPLHPPGEPAAAGEARHSLLVCVTPRRRLPLVMPVPVLVMVLVLMLMLTCERRVLRRQPDPREAAAQRRRGMPRLHDGPDGQAGEGAQCDPGNRAWADERR